jgi:hypothetical protein
MRRGIYRKDWIRGLMERQGSTSPTLVENQHRDPYWEEREKE